MICLVNLHGYLLCRFIEKKYLQVLDGIHQWPNEAPQGGPATQPSRKQVNIAIVIYFHFKKRQNQTFKTHIVNYLKIKTPFLISLMCFGRLILPLQKQLIFLNENVWIFFSFFFSLERGRSKWVFALSVSLPVETKINPRRLFLACSGRFVFSFIIEVKVQNNKPFF